MNPDLDVGEVHVGGEEVAVGGPRHALLHLALRRVEDGLVRARSGRRVCYNTHHIMRMFSIPGGDFIRDDLPCFFSDGDKFTPQKFLVDHFDNLVNLLTLVRGKPLETLAREPEVQELAHVLILHVGLVQLHAVRVGEQVVEVLRPLEVGGAGVGGVGLGEGRRHVRAPLGLEPAAHGAGLRASGRGGGHRVSHLGDKYFY